MCVCVGAILLSSPRGDFHRVNRNQVSCVYTLNFYLRAFIEVDVFAGWCIGARAGASKAFPHLTDCWQRARCSTALANVLMPASSPLLSASVTLLWCTHLCTCSNCASSNRRKSNPTERRSTTEEQRKRERESFEKDEQLQSTKYSLSLSLSLSLFHLLNFLVFFPIRHFILYVSRDLLSPTTYVLIRLYKYARETKARRERQREIGIIYVHSNLSLLLSFLSILLVFIWYWYPFH